LYVAAFAFGALHDQLKRIYNEIRDSHYLVGTELANSGGPVSALIAKANDDAQKALIEYNKKAKENEDYEKAYGYYSSRSYARAKNYCDSVITRDAQNGLICKYKLLRAVCVG
jgi:hypothetical protein